MKSENGECNTTIMIPPPPPHAPPVQHNSTAPPPSSHTINIQECKWAEEQPELRKACFLAKICLQHPPVHCQYRDIASIIQEGPTCGLTCISMILNGEFISVAEMLQKCQELGFSNNGEMFSAQYVVELITHHLPPSNMRSLSECHLHQGPLDCDEIRNSLIAGKCLLVPYPFSKQ